MEWIIAHWAHIAFGLMVAERVAKETPPDLKIAGIPIGKYDDQVIKAIKNILSAVVGVKKTSK